MEPSRPTLSTDAFGSLHVPITINNVEIALPSTFDVTSPYNTTVPAWTCSSAGPTEATQAVEAASTAFPAWSSTKPSTRRDILLRAAQLMEDRTEVLAACMRTEMGADVGASSGFIVPLGVAMVRDCAARISAIQGWVPEVDLPGQSAVVMQIPVGVVLGIVPWNAPYVFGSRSIATTLAAGCTTVIKASEITPRSYQLLARCFYDAGVPPGVLNVISCHPSHAAEVVSTMVAHPAVRKINFTGSTAVGRQIAIKCAEHLKPSVMELGGKNSALVLRDADLEQAATQCILGGFLNSGQICMSTDRIIVDRAVIAEFRSCLIDVLSKIFTMKNPPPTLVSEASRDRIKAAVNEARAQGAADLLHGHSTGGSNDITNSADDRQEKGVFFRPTVLGDVTPEMGVWRDEMFGSVVAVAEADGDEDMIRMANRTDYGLSAAVFTRDWRRGMAVAKRIEAGLVHINSLTVHDEPMLPFGGVKASGWGRFNGVKGLEEFLVTKSVTWMD